MSKIPVCNSLKEAIQLTFGRDVSIKSRQRVHGGDANDAYALCLSNGQKAFIKENTISNADSFRAEAEGLAAIRSTGTLKVPEIYALGTTSSAETSYMNSGLSMKSSGKNVPTSSFLLMEFIDRHGTCKGFWENLGRGLASMHKVDTGSFTGTSTYGFTSDNYIGAGKQKNTPKHTWIEFFSECRLKPQFRLAASYFDDRLLEAANHLLDNLDKYLFEPDRPSLLHGDLWAGNFMSDENGQPMLIDPAVYVGCSEADIAMTELFGGFDRRFYASYFEEMGEIPGYDDRRDLYNLYHLTNHLNIFGSAYLSAVSRILLRYR